MRTCSLVAPSQNPNAAKQMYSYFGDTTLAFNGANHRLVRAMANNLNFGPLGD
jgi:hypothetical protein